MARATTHNFDKEQKKEIRFSITFHGTIKRSELVETMEDHMNTVLRSFHTDLVAGVKLLGKSIRIDELP